MKHFLFIPLFLFSLLAFAQRGTVYLGGDLAFPGGNFKALAEDGVGAFLGYRTRASNRFSSFIEVEYLGFAKKTTYRGGYWLSSKVSAINFRVGGKYSVAKSSRLQRLYISGEVGTSTMYLIGDSNLGLGTDTHETDFGYAPGLGYTFNRFDIRYSLQFIKISGGLNFNNSHSMTVNYSSLKVDYNF